MNETGQSRQDVHGQMSPDRQCLAGLAIFSDKANLAPSTDALSLAAAPEEDKEVAEPCRGPTDDLGRWSADNVGVVVVSALMPPSDDGVWPSLDRFKTCLS